MNTIKNIKNRISKSDNRGDALILVIVAMFLIMFLGLSLLFATYTAYMIRHTERKSETTFTSADTGMDLIKNGLTDAESKAAEQGYAGVLNLYTSLSDDSIVFRQQFLESIAQIGVNKNTGEVSLYDSADPATANRNYAMFPGTSKDANGNMVISKYDVRAVEKFLKVAATGSTDDTFSFCAIKTDPATGKKIEIHSGDTDPTGDVEQGKDGSLLLKNLHLEYTRKDGYVTTITTDIRMSIPDSAEIIPAGNPSTDDLSRYSCIADQGLINYDPTEGGTSHPGGRFQGSIYAGMVEMYGNQIDLPANHFMIVGRTNQVIRDADDNAAGFNTNNKTSGEMTFKGNGSGIKMNDNSQLWTQDINLINGASLNSSDTSSIYVADDLNFKEGSNAASTADIGGTFIGFGNGNYSNNSSSIVFNDGTHKGILDVSRVRELTLAGTAYVLQKDGEEGTEGGQVKMGNSIATRAEQIAYLVPAGEDKDLGEIKNPATGADEQEITNNALAKIADNNDKAGVFGLTKPLSDYGIRTAADIKTMTVGGADGTEETTYYFLNFSSRSMANQYFKDYFSSHTNEVTKYITDYADIRGVDTSKVLASGTTLEKNGDSYNIIDGAGDDSEVLDSKAADYQKKYANLCTTLNEKKNNNRTPFFTFINEKKLHELVGAKNSAPRAICWWVDQNEPNNWNVDSSNLVQRSTDNRYLFCIGGEYVTKTGKKFTIDPDPNNKQAGICRDIDTGAGMTGRTINGERGGYAAWGDNVEMTDINNKSNFWVVDGNVSVRNPDYKGMVMCSGTVYMKKGGFEMNTESLYGFVSLKNSAIWAGGKVQDATVKNQKDWSLDEQVDYENWKKN